MKKIIKFPALLMIAALLLSLSSCEKDRLSLLTGGEWQFENITTNNEDQNIKDIVAGLKAIYTDGTLRFFSDNTYIKEFALIDDESGTWELVGSTQLIFSPDAGGVMTSSIDKISKSELVYIETYVDPTTSNTFNTTTTWVK